MEMKKATPESFETFGRRFSKEQKSKRADGKSMVVGHALFRIRSLSSVASRILVLADSTHRRELFEQRTPILCRGITNHEEVLRNVTECANITKRAARPSTRRPFRGPWKAM
jgi:hypothetical protein